MDKELVPQPGLSRVLSAWSPVCEVGTACRCSRNHRKQQQADSIGDQQRRFHLALAVCRQCRRHQHEGGDLRTLTQRPELRRRVPCCYRVRRASGPRRRTMATWSGSSRRDDREISTGLDHRNRFRETIRYFGSDLCPIGEVEGNFDEVAAVTLERDQLHACQFTIFFGFQQKPK